MDTPRWSPGYVRRHVVNHYPISKKRTEKDSKRNVDAVPTFDPEVARGYVDKAIERRDYISACRISIHIGFNKITSESFSQSTAAYVAKNCALVSQ